MKLLKRNATERMEFEDFFDHPFVKARTKSNPSGSSSPTKPVAISSRTPSLESSPGSYGSPVMMNLASRNSPSGKSLPGSSPNKQTSHDFVDEKARLRRLRQLTQEDRVSGSSSSDEQLDDFVVVPKPKSNASGSPRDSLSSPRGRSYSVPDPVPVPSQKANYEKMMTRSRQRSENTSSKEILSSVPEDVVDSKRDKDLKNSCGSSPPSRFGVTDVAQLTPPEVTFVIGTPPGNAGSAAYFASAGRRTSMPLLKGDSREHLPQFGATSPKQGSLVRQVTPPYNLAVTPFGSTSADLKTDKLSPFNWTFRTNPTVRSPVSSPLAERRSIHGQASLGRAITLDVNHTGYHPGFPSPGPLAYQSGHVHPYAQQQHYGHHHGSSVCCCVAPHVAGGGRPISAPFASPQDYMMDDDHFVPPELPAETLLDRGHNETLAKLNFALALVDSIMNIAESRGSPLTILTESTTVGNVKIPAEIQRKAEQLVLYLRCLHLISSAFQLSKQEVLSGKLKASSSVRNG